MWRASNRAREPESTSLFSYIKFPDTISSLFFWLSFISSWRVVWGWVDGWTGDLLIQSSSFLFSLRLFWKGELLNCDLLASGASQFSIFGLLSPHWLPTHPHPLLREKERDPLHLLVFLANPQRDVWGLSHRRRRLFPLFLFSFLCAWLQVLEESLESAKQLVSVSSISRHTQRNRAQPLSPTWLTHHNPHREEDDSRNKKKNELTNLINRTKG